MNRLRFIEDETKREYQNLKKSINRARTLQGILLKSEKLKDLRKEYKTVLHSFQYRLSPKDWQLEVAYYEKLKSVFEDCQKILDNSKILPTFKSIAKTVIICNRLKNSPVKPVTMPFEIKEATALVQTYDGSADGLGAFVDSVNLLAELTPDDQVPTAIKFLKTRLTGKARLGLPEAIKTIDALAQDVKRRCASKITPENITAKLKAVRQKGSAETFCDEVESLTTKLKAVYIQSNIPEPVANNMATKAGVETLVNGTNSQETKIILKAGTFTDIKDAIQKVLDNTNSNATQVLSFNARGNNYHQGQNQRYRNNRGNRRFLNNRGHHQNSQNSRNPQHQQPQYNQHPRYGGYQNNRGRRGRFNFQSGRIYAASAQPQQVQIDMPTNMPMAIMGNRQQEMMMPTASNPMLFAQNNMPFLGQLGQNMTPQN